MTTYFNDFENVDSHRFAVDIDQQQLKKQSIQVKRFGNAEIKEHRQLNNVSSALQVLDPKQLIRMLESTQNAINGNGGTVDLVRQDIPELAEPYSEVSDNVMSDSTRMMYLLNTINQLTSDSSLQNQLSLLKSYNASMEGTKNTYSELAAALESQGEQWAHDSDGLKKAQIESSKLEKEVKAAESDLQNAQKKLTKLEAESQRQDPVSSELSQEIQEAKNAVVVAQIGVDKTTQAFNQHTTNSLIPAINAENSSKIALNKTLAQSREITSSMPPQQQVVIENQRKHDNEHVKSLAFLMSLISQLIEQSSHDELQASTEFKIKLSQAETRHAEKKAQEYEDNVRKSEEMQKTMGCIGKTLGWLITTVSFAAAIFTGGASLAFAAIGLALTIGDEINQAVNGFSFMTEALKPVMEAIVQPLMESLSNIFSKMLESFGVDKSKAEMIGQIMGMVATAAVMIVAIIVAGRVASKFAGMVVEKFGKKVMDKILNNSIGDMMKRIGQGMGQAFGMQEDKIARVANYTNMGQTGMSIADTTIQTAGNINIATLNLDAVKAKVKLSISATIQEMLNKNLDSAVETFIIKMQRYNKIITDAASVIEKQAQTNKSLIKYTGVLAG